MLSDLRQVWILAVLLFVLGILINRYAVPLVYVHDVGLTVHGTKESGCRFEASHFRRTPWAKTQRDEVYVAKCDDRTSVNEHVLLACDCRP
jgi:hypothetical protein